MSFRSSPMQGYRHRQFALRCGIKDHVMDFDDRPSMHELCVSGLVTSEILQTT